MRKNMNNPFIIFGYLSPDYFCDREIETEKIISALDNGRNITLLSLRRMGKTGLIYHVFHQLSEKTKDRLIYFDIMPTSNLNEFIREFSKAIINEEQKRSKNYLSKLKDLLTGLRGKITFDQVTGAPGFEIEYHKPEESINDLLAIFQFLAKQKSNYIIAIDEFQQITTYPEKNVEALLRSYCQQYNKNINFIFSGSNKKILTSMFSQYGKPFYQSSDIMNLGKIDRPEYAEFIYLHFKANKRKLEKELIYKILDDLDLYTFYVQYFFNKLYGTQIINIDAILINKVLSDILNERESIYYSYKSFLTDNQFALVKAIAKEKKVSQPTSSLFLKTYRLNQASSVKRSLQALLDKEIIYKEDNFYCVYDLFFQKWLSKY